MSEREYHFAKHANQINFLIPKKIFNAIAITIKFQKDPPHPHQTRKREKLFIYKLEVFDFSFRITYFCCFFLLIIIIISNGFCILNFAFQTINRPKKLEKLNVKFVCMVHA